MWWWMCECVRVCVCPLPSPCTHACAPTYMQVKEVVEATWADDGVGEEGEEGEGA